MKETTNPVSRDEEMLSVMEDAENNDGDMVYGYRLYEICTYGKKLYAISVSHGEDFEFETVGKNYDEAKNLFETIVRWTASPCELRDIVSDMICANMI